jgi:nuclear transport factor 2 (NTF2) superfamily protein
MAKAHRGWNITNRDKILWLFAPSEIRIRFECEWHDHAYNWFDIELLRHSPRRLS